MIDLLINVLAICKEKRNECLDLKTKLLKEQIEDVLEGCPEERQMMMFSATIPKHIRSLTEAYMRDPEIVDITKDQKTAGSLSVQHKVLAMICYG